MPIAQPSLPMQRVRGHWRIAGCNRDPATPLARSQTRLPDSQSPSETHPPRQKVTSDRIVRTPTRTLGRESNSSRRLAVFRPSPFQYRTPEYDSRSVHAIVSPFRRPFGRDERTRAVLVAVQVRRSDKQLSEYGSGGNR